MIWSEGLFGLGIIIITENFYKSRNYNNLNIYMLYMFYMNVNKSKVFLGNWVAI